MKIIIVLYLLTAVLGEVPPPYSYNDTIIEEDFRALDTNTDGILTLHEADNKFRRGDVNGDSRLTFVEFHKVLRPGLSLAISYAAFNINDQLDGHKDYFIDLWDSKMIFSLLDTDHNKNVTLEEYKNAVKLTKERILHDAGITA